MKVSVIIPLFNNACRELLNCLAGLNEQTVLPEEVIIVSNIPLKLPSYKFNAKTIIIEKPLSIATAINAGLKLVRTEIVCFTDPDTVPYENWIQKIIEVYKSDTRIGGVGGRDEIYRDDKLAKTKGVRTVGKLTVWGRLIGNHHDVLPAPQEVDFLKGSNMSFRKELVTGFDESIIGFYWWEQPVCLKIKSCGYKLIYSPDIKVKHFKYNGQVRTEKDIFMHSKNTTYLVLRYGFWVRKPLFLVYIFLIGQTHKPGILKAIVSSSLMDFTGFLSASTRGKIRGIKLFLSLRK
ncbi:MAG: glycosyltransferase [bacterium]|nr:glycosyltransferase [bacterium]